MARKIEVQLVGTAKSLVRAFNSSSSSGSKWAGRMKGVMKAGGLAIAAGVGAGVVALKSSVDAAKEAELSQRRVQAQLKAAGLSYRKYAGQIDATLESQSRLSAFDDEDLADSFTNIVRITGDVNKALKLNALAADFARAKGMDVAKAGELIGKVVGGNTGILSRYGIQLKDGATKQEALAELQKKFAGQAEAYGQSTAGAQERFGVAVENLQEKIGQKLLPVLTQLAEWGIQFIGWAEKNWPKFQQIVSDAVAKIRPHFERLIAYWNGTLLPAIKAVIELARKFWNRFGDDIKLVFGEVKSLIKNALEIIKGIIETVMAVIRGDWSEAWQKLKGVVRNVLEGVKALLLDFPGRILGFAIDIGKALVEGILVGVSNLGSALLDKLKAGISGALDGVKGAFGIGSPSKVFAEQVGKPIAQGIAQGIRDAAMAVPAATVGTVGGGLAATAKATAAAPAAAASGGPGRYLILADDQTVRFLQGLNLRHSRGNGGKPIW